MLIVAIVIAAITLMLGNSRFQDFAVRKISQIVSEQTSLHLEVGSADFVWRRGEFKFKGVRLSEGSGQAVLTADRLETEIQWLPLTRGRLRVDALRIISPHLSLYRQTENSQLQLRTLEGDSLSSVNPQHGSENVSSHEKNDFWKEISLAHLVVMDGTLDYEVLSPTRRNSFDCQHWSDLQLKGSGAWQMLPEECFGLNISHMSAKEQNGFQLSSLTSGLYVKDGLWRLNGLDLQLPASYLKVDTTILRVFAFDADSLSLPFGCHLQAFLSSEDFPEAASARRNFGDRQLSIDVNLSGDSRKLDVEKLLVESPGLVLIEGSLSGLYLTDADNRQLQADWKNLHVQTELFDLLADCDEKLSVALPKEIRCLSYADYEGTCLWRPGQMALDGELESVPGKLDLTAQVVTDENGRTDFQALLGSQSLDLGSIWRGSTLGKTSFRADIQGNNNSKKGLSAQADVRIDRFPCQGYTYRHLHVQAHRQGKGKTDVALHSDDPNCQVELNAALARNGSHGVDLSLQMLSKRLNLQALNVIGEIEDDTPDLTFALTADLKGKSIDEFEGKLQIDSLRLDNNRTHFELPSLDLYALENERQTQILLHSDVLDGQLNGNVNFSTLLPSLLAVSQQAYLPALLPDTRTNVTELDDWNMNLEISGLDSLFKAVGIPLSLEGTARLDAYAHRNGRLGLDFVADAVEWNDLKCQNPDFALNNDDPSFLEWNFGTFCEMGKNRQLIRLTGQAADDSVRLDVHMTDAGNPDQYSELSSCHLLLRESADSPLQVKSLLSSEHIFLSDSVWTLHPTRLFWDGNRLAVDSLYMEEGDQYLMADGFVSNLASDTLRVDMRQLSLDNLYRMIPSSRRKKGFFMGGDISGQALLASLFEGPQIMAEIHVDDFALCNHRMGDLNASSHWDPQLGIVLEGIVDDGGDELGQIGGFYKLQRDSLHLDIDSYGLPVDFISHFSNPLLSLGGKAYGPIEVNVCAKSRVTSVQTRALIREGQVGLGKLGAMYAFEDTVVMTPGSIVFNQLRLTDDEGNQATLDGKLYHNRFNSFGFDLNMPVNHFKIVDLAPTASEEIHGTVFATGQIALTGDDSDTQLDINLRTDDRSTVAVSLLNQASDVGEFSYIEFIDESARNDSSLHSVAIPVQTARSSRRRKQTDFHAVVQLEMTPSAELVLITDPGSGDEMRVRGSGRIRAVYDNRENLAIYGRYELESGRYRFSFQELINRDFNILQGSSINFSGDPMASTLNIQASHTVYNVSLSDLLDESEIASMNMNRTSIPVNCTLNISGELEQPDLTLGLEFPAADEELRRRIMNVINTDEILNRQIVYLLLLNRFAATDNVADNTANNNMTAVVGVTLNTLSRQLNRMIYQALGTDNLSFDLNYKNDDFSTMGEWQVAMTSQLMDNRLTINGNIGSREDLVNNDTQFIGDFDLEYKFTQSGRWRLKMFNRSNDSRYFKSAMTTQGMGIVYKEQFNTFSELRQTFRQRLVNAFRKK